MTPAFDKPTGKERSEYLQSFAKQMLLDTNFDVWQPVNWRKLAPVMAEQAQCHSETAKRHLAKAARRLRGEYVAQRGGKREGAGRPKDDDGKS
jgi:hypothetical protein